MVVTTQEFDVKQWVKTRASLDGSSSFLTWAGSIYSFVPNESNKHLFKIVGMSVSRCIPTENNNWNFTSRELTYYLDPDTGEILHKWENPWTGEIVNVVHVANNPVQRKFQGNFSAEVNGEITTFVFNLFANYPNPLAEDIRFIDYSPTPIYQAAELFKLTVFTEELLNPEIISVSKMNISWDRIGPWLPWMKMGKKEGNLIYSATGSKANSFNDLPQLLKEEINNHIPLYKQAPSSYLDREDMTSWSYFKKHFDAYVKGKRFPIVEVEE